MADLKISQLTAATSVQSSDTFVIARSGANYKVPISVLFNTIPTYIGNSQNVEQISSSGAISVTSSITEFATTAAINCTLAAGISGQEKILLFRNKIVGDVLITVPNSLGFDTITLTNTGNCVVLKYIGSTWVILSNNGATIA